MRVVKQCDNRYVPNTWRRIVCDGVRGVGYTCPNGHAGVLAHVIREDGTVQPSVVCPEDGCGFHEYIQLADWKPAEG